MTKRNKAITDTLAAKGLKHPKRVRPLPVSMAAIQVVAHDEAEFVVRRLIEERDKQTSESRKRAEVLNAGGWEKLEGWQNTNASAIANLERVLVATQIQLTAHDEAQALQHAELSTQIPQTVLTVEPKRDAEYGVIGAKLDLVESYLKTLSAPKPDPIGSQFTELTAMICRRDDERFLQVQRIELELQAARRAWTIVTVLFGVLASVVTVAGIFYARAHGLIR